MPPRQRAVLLLCDVLAFSANETADADDRLARIAVFADPAVIARFT